MDSIISEIKNFMAKWDPSSLYSDWYVGIASSPSERLFNDHNVNEKTDGWIYRPCLTSAMARSIEDHFIELGADGGPGGGDHTTRHVYAYRKGNHTKET